MDPLKAEIEKYEQERNVLTSQLTEAETDLADYMLLLSKFESEFLSSVDREQQRLLRWEQRCAIVEQVIRKLERIQWGAEDLPSSMAPLIQEAEEQILPSGEVQRQEAPADLSEQEAVEARNLYRQLARRFHPDLVSQEELQVQRKKLMSEINEAWQKQDIQALRNLQHRPDIRDESQESLGQKWERLVREIAMFAQKIQESRSRLIKAQSSELALLMDSVNQGDREQQFEQIRQELHRKSDFFRSKWKQLRHQELRLWMDLD